MERLKLSLNIALSFLILLILARLLADYAAYRLGSCTSFLSRPVSSQVAVQTVEKNISLQSNSAILEKGLFGEQTRGVLTPILLNSSNKAAVPAQNDLILIGTAIGTSGGGFILSRRISTNEERVFKVGQKVFDIGILTSVRKESAELRSGGRITVLQTPSAVAENIRPAITQGETAGVYKSSGSSVAIIEQQALNLALENIGQAMSDARLLPHLKDGKVNGFTLSEVKPGGVFGTIGLKNGDLLQMINDYRIDSPEKAVQSFMTLKGQTRIKLDLIRDGLPTSLLYDIR